MNTGESKPEKQKNMSLELLRCIAMMMVVVLHFLGKGNLLTPLTERDFSAVSYAAWFLEAFAIVAVNVYMLISGYFLCEASFKPTRLLKLLLQVWSYSVVVGGISLLLGSEGVTHTTYTYLQLLLPISMEQYWFMSVYVFLYLLLPFVGVAVKKMTKEQLAVSTLFLFAIFCVLKSILPVRLDMDKKGYDFFWYLCVFLAAAYIRKFGLPFLKEKGKALILYLVACLLIFVGTCVLRAFYLKTGSLSLILGILMEYNHLLPFLAAVGLFIAFTGIDLRNSVLLRLAGLGKYTLGVYLLHENLIVRYQWQKLFGAERIGTIPALLFSTVCAVVVVFLAGILLEFVRTEAMKGLHNLLLNTSMYHNFIMKLESLDSIFNTN